MKRDPAGGGLAGAELVSVGVGLVGGSVGTVGSLGAVGPGVVGAACRGILGRRAVAEITTGAAEVGTAGAVLVVAVGGATVGAYAALQPHAARPTDTAAPPRRAPHRTLTVAEGMAPLRFGGGSRRR